MTVPGTRASPSGGADSTRDRIVAAAVELLTEGGRAAVSTRAVGAAAGVQAPTIYRIFGDKQGLLDAVAAHGFAAHLRIHTDLAPSDEPVQDLRAGWDAHVGFGLANPYLYSLIYGERHPDGSVPPAAVAAREVLAGHVRRIAEAGRLRVAEERAVRLLHAAGCGTTLTLIGMPADRRDQALSELAREAVIAAVTIDTPAPAAAGPVGAAVALRAALPHTSALTASELALLRDWLDRIAEAD